jgi:hypothetical protein
MSSAEVILNRQQVRSQTCFQPACILCVKTKALESLRSVSKLEYERIHQGTEEDTRDVWVRLTGSIIAFRGRTVRRTMAPACMTAALFVGNAKAAMPEGTAGGVWGINEATCRKYGRLRLRGGCVLASLLEAGPFLSNFFTFRYTATVALPLLAH